MKRGRTRGLSQDTLTSELLTEIQERDATEPYGEAERDGNCEASTEALVRDRFDIHLGKLQRNLSASLESAQRKLAVGHLAAQRELQEAHERALRLIGSGADQEQLDPRGSPSPPTSPRRVSKVSVESVHSIEVKTGRQCTSRSRGSSPERDAGGASSTNENMLLPPGSIREKERPKRNQVTLTTQSLDSSIGENSSEGSGDERTQTNKDIKRITIHSTVGPGPMAPVFGPDEVYEVKRRNMDEARKSMRKSIASQSSCKSQRLRSSDTFESAATGGMCRLNYSVSGISSATSRGEWVMPDLHPVWKEGVGQQKMLKRAMSHKVEKLVACKTEEPKEFLQRWVARPNSIHRLLWDFTSLLAVLYDVVTVPLEVAFSPPENLFTVCADWFTAVFWTCDFIFSFFTGYHSDGLVEMRPSRIAQNYLRTTFTFDLVVITVDWMLMMMLVGAGQDAAGIFRITKTARSMRIMRLLRMLRLARLIRGLTTVSDLVGLIKSDYIRTIAGVLALLLAIVGINHYLACGFYYIGSTQMDNANWIEAAGLMDAETQYRYMTAMHWSLTQFTPASMEVRPYNEPERLYSIIVLLFAMITFSSFMSMITSSMIYLQKLKTASAQQEALLRRFFNENGISAELGQRIWKYVWNKHLAHSQRLHEADINIFAILPDTLRRDLHEELYLKTLLAAPVMHHLSTFDAEGVIDICHQCLTEISKRHGEELYQEAVSADSMFFITDGELTFEHISGSLERNATLTAGQWICEPALWVAWITTGRTSATTTCEVIRLSSEGFRKVISKNRHALDFCRSYASAFVAHMKSHVIECLDSENCLDAWATDVWTEVEDLWNLVTTVGSLHSATGLATRKVHRGQNHGHARQTLSSMTHAARVAASHIPHRPRPPPSQEGASGGRQRPSRMAPIIFGGRRSQ